jgi:hypothetical protein
MSNQEAAPQIAFARTSRTSGSRATSQLSHGWLTAGHPLDYLPLPCLLKRRQAGATFPPGLETVTPGQPPGVRAPQSGAVRPLGFGDAGREGTPPRYRKNSPPDSRDPPRFHNASTAPFGTCLSAAAMADIPLQKRPPEDTPGRTRTCDPLLRRREHLLRSAAACRSGRSASDGPHIADAFCCGLPLPQRFHRAASSRPSFACSVHA